MPQFNLQKFNWWFDAEPLLTLNNVPGSFVKGIGRRESPVIIPPRGKKTPARVKLINQPLPVAEVAEVPSGHKVEPIENVLNILYEGRKDTVNILNSNESFVNYLLKRNSLCSTIRSLSLEKLSEPSFLFSKVIFENGNQKDMIVKKINGGVVEYEAGVLLGPSFEGDQMTADNFVKKLVNKGIVENEDRVISLNRNGAWNYPNDMVNKNTIVKIQEYNTLCLTSEEKKYTTIDGNDRITFPPRSYLCKSKDYVEYAMSILFSQLYESGNNNFIQVFGFESCMGPNRILDKDTQYVFVEKMDGSVSDIQGTIVKWNDEQLASLYIQVMYIISKLLQLGVVHRRLSIQNLYYRDVVNTTNPVLKANFENKNYGVIIGGDAYYIPYIPTIITIGNFESSIKFTKPMIAWADSFKDGRPNWFSSSYDIIRFTIDLFKLFHNRGIKNTFINQISSYILFSVKNSSTENINAKIGEIVDPKTMQEFVRKVDGKLTPENVMKLDIFEKYKEERGPWTILGN